MVRLKRFEEECQGLFAPLDLSPPTEALTTILQHDEDAFLPPPNTSLESSGSGDAVRDGQLISESTVTEEESREFQKTVFDGRESDLSAINSTLFPAPGLEPQQTPVVYRTACLTANNAFEHLRLRQIDIIRAMGRPEIPMIALAGFNEGLLQQDMATLLQEIHIVPSKNFAPPQHVLDGVGKACSPFPSMIFMPSGTTFRPPVFNSEGKSLTFEDLIPPPASKPRLTIALDKGQTSAVHGSTASADDHGQSPSDGTQDGQNQAEQSTNSPTESSGAQPQPIVLRRSSSDDELQPREDENRGDDGRSTVPRNTTTGENTSIAQGGEHMPLSQGPPVPGDDGSATQRPHTIRFDMAAAIYQPSPGAGLLQTLRLTGNFNFQVCAQLWVSFL
jgi:hypothetical protein